MNKWITARHKLSKCTQRNLTEGRDRFTTNFTESRCDIKINSVWSKQAETLTPDFRLQYFRLITLTNEWDGDHLILKDRKCTFFSHVHRAEWYDLHFMEEIKMQFISEATPEIASQRVASCRTKEITNCDQTTKDFRRFFCNKDNNFTKLTGCSQQPKHLLWLYQKRTLRHPLVVDILEMQLSYFKRQNYEPTIFILRFLPFHHIPQLRAVIPSHTDTLRYCIPVAYIHLRTSTFTFLFLQTATTALHKLCHHCWQPLCLNTRLSFQRPPYIIEHLGF